MDPTPRQRETEPDSEKETGTKNEQSGCAAAADHSGDTGNVASDGSGKDGDSGYSGGNKYIQVLACFILWFNSW